jgi:uncharacterized protein
MSTELLLARCRPSTMEPKDSIGAKWERLLDGLDLGAAVRGRRTAIKVHLGGGYGFTTIHPWFMRTLVAKVKAAGAAEVFATDGAQAVRSAVERGYTEEVLGCPILPVAGEDDRQVTVAPVDPPFLGLSEVRVARQIVEAGALIDFSHVKGHGSCGLGGATKNLSMGCVDQPTRAALHGLEGGLEWDGEKCTLCRTCEQNCPNGVISFPGDRFKVFYHNCKLCQHCVLICPQKAISTSGGTFRDFQRGMAIAAQKVLDRFDRTNLLFISMLMNITPFCDCWGMTTPAVVPDIGILAGRDIAAIEAASLDLVRTEDLIPRSLPPGWDLGAQGHLFERIHRKDPFVVLGYLEQLGGWSRAYTLRETL